MRLVCKSDKEWSAENLEELVKDLPMRLVIKLLKICKEEIESQNEVKVNIKYADIG